MSETAQTLTETKVTTTEYYREVPGKKNLRRVEKTVRTEEYYRNTNPVVE